MSIRTFAGVTPSLAEAVFVDSAATVIGQVSIGKDSSIWPGVVARGDVEKISIGQRSNIQDNSVLHVTHDGPYTPGGAGLTIGDDVTVGHMALLHACTVGNRCLIGMSATVMDKAVLEDDVLLAAGSLVTPKQRLEAGHLYRGSPAKKVRALSPEELESLKYSAANYVRLKNRYLKNRYLNEQPQ